MSNSTSPVKGSPTEDNGPNNQPVTILISGGHLTPAVATIEYLQKAHPQVKIVFVGRKYSQESTQQLAKEREVCQQLNVPFYTLDAAKFHRSAWWRNIYELPRLIPSFWQAYRLIKDNNVDAFLTFGGYLAVPLAVAAKLQKIILITHEQTKSSGLANELISIFADKIAISHAQSLHNFPQHKTIITGNPIRPQLFRKYTRPPTWLKNQTKPILYITGGSQGSQTINNVISKILDNLLDKFTIIHQVGKSPNQRYLREMNEAKANLNSSKADRYYPQEWLDEQEISWIMQHAVLAIGRSGANTTLEMTIHALPAIFIPLPFAYNNEQYKNAQELSQAEAAVILEQKDLTPQSLLKAVQQTSADRSNMKKRAQKLRDDLILNGAKNLAELTLSLIASNQ